MHRLRFKNGVFFIGATSTVVALAVQSDASDTDSFVASVRCRRRKFLRNSGIEDSSMPSVLLKSKSENFSVVELAPLDLSIISRTHPQPAKMLLINDQ